ncbi:LytR/AlgR family response regulator transcription factor [Aquimarina sp. 2201CG14-23]|uniref:LytR/AlgR family response regulator transcription factor n=1 Tax=Aquimarina mycalae TaxID=3040073 RepID=UPI0024781716|nr:LytTR family DNA-binding domain-containing protein [Aquimarina sp. 2201CG14-23]MDH7445854.1 LytTR family DNA-binding domain-containing protein [Aquimarina sp. 2201CG14-23]
MNEFNAIIIEDEPYHVELLTQILKRNCPYVNVCSFANSVSEANSCLKEKEFDIIFLDINLGKDCAFEWLKTVSYIDDKELVITTSHQKYAIEAFKHVATDYVLKPMVLEDVIQAVEKAKKNIEIKRMASLHNQKFDDKDPLKMIAIPSTTDVKIIPVNEIIYLQSEGRYTMFHTKNNTTTIASKNLGEYEKSLVNNNFFRIHHSYLVNMDCALNVHKKDGNYLETSNHQYLPISKRKVDSFYQYLGIK